MAVFIAVFWHLDVFRRSFRRLNGHLCMGNSCIFCALKVIFTQLQFSDKSSLTPDTLRKALAETFVNEQRFQLGHMHDAAECFENILQRIHYHIANDHSDDTCSALHCLPHRKFAMTVTEEMICSCGASSKPLTFHELVHYISATSLISQSSLMQEAGDELHPDRFGLLLRNASAVGDIRDCPGDCGKRVQIRRSLLNCPDVVNIGIVWDSERPSGEMITQVARSIGTTMLLPDVFHSVMYPSLPRLQLVAMVCYYGKHYSTFVFHTKLKMWIYFDDATVREIGPRWEHVVEKCVRGRYQPLLLYYTNPTATPISIDTAPTKKVMAPGYNSHSGTPVGKGVQKGEVPSDTTAHCHSKAKRSLTPHSDISIDAPGSQRSTTPGLEHGGVDYDKIMKGEHHRQPSFLFAMSGKNETHDDTLACILESHPASLRHVESVPNDIGRESERFTRDYRYNGGPVSAAQDQSKLSTAQQETVDTYTLSTRDPYRRPSINNLELGNVPLTTNFTRSEAQRKDSFKKGKKIAADVIRYQVDSGMGHSSSESDTSPLPNDIVDGPLSQTSKGTFSSRSIHGPPNNMASRHVRTRSQSLEDDTEGILCNDPSRLQMKSVNPVPSNLNTVSTHTPVQSGLATLPRKKNSNKENVSNSNDSQQYHFRQNSFQNELVNHSRQSSSQSGYRQSPVPNSYQTLGGKVPHNYESDRHCRQDSNTSHGSVQSQQSQHSSSSQEKSGETKEKRTRKKRDSDVKSAKQSSQSKISDTRPPEQINRNSAQKQKEGFVDDAVVYIDRKMVETILNHQKVHRQVSVTSHTSNSSIESDTIKDRKNDRLTVEIPFDTISLESQKDSGYGSSDRNSSSSAGSITMDPYTQYFVSRSMIPPKTIKPPTQLYAYHAEMDQAPSPKQHPSALLNRSAGHIGSVDTTGLNGKPPINPKRLSPAREEAHHVYKTKLAAEHPPRHRNAPTDSRPPNMTASRMSANPHGHTGQFSKTKMVENNQKTPDSPRNSPLLPSVCQTAQGRSGTPTNATPGAPATHSHMPNTHTGDQRTAEFYSLCRMAEDLMDQCMLAEADGGFSIALQQCSKAVECMQKAMRSSGLSQSLFDEVQRKHNSCLLKLRSLQKRSSGRRESTKSPNPQHNCSLTSSDSESTGSDFAQNQNTTHQLVSPSSQQMRKTRPSSTLNSRDSIDSLKDTRNSGSNSSIGSVDSVKQAMPQRGGNLLRTECSNSAMGENEKYDIYATLPRKGRKNALNRTNSNPCEDNNALQRVKNASPDCIHVRTSSGSSTSTTTSSKDYDTTRPASSGTVPNISNQQKKMSKSDIRQLLEKNMYQRQNQRQDQPVNSNRGQMPVHQPSYRVPPNYSQPIVAQTAEVGRKVPLAPIQQTMPLAPAQQTKPMRAFPQSVSMTSIPTGNRGTNNIAGSVSTNSNQAYNHYSAGGQGTMGRSSSQPNYQCLTNTPGAFIREATLDKQSCQGTTPLSNWGSMPSVNQIPDHLPLSAGETDVGETNDAFRPSVRDLASRFESAVDIEPPNENGDSRTTKLTRKRSKSESSTRPKSVLARTKKSVHNKPRKSVTFADQISLESTCNKLEINCQSGYHSDKEDLGYENTPISYSDNDLDDDDTSTSADSPVEVSGAACGLCHKKGIVRGMNFCTKCSYYMSQFKPS
ncbi:hypothetical protein ScPMuIL_003556 [Solemya velum]